MLILNLSCLHGIFAPIKMYAELKARRKVCGIPMENKNKFAVPTSNNGNIFPSFSLAFLYN
jgi:hypothetical protein